MKNNILMFLKEKVLGFILNHKIPTAIIAAVLALSITVASLAVSHSKNGIAEEKGNTSSEVSSQLTSAEPTPVESEEVSAESETVSEISSVASASSSKPTVSSSKKQTTSSSKKQTSSSKKQTSTATTNKTVNTNYKYNTNSDINNNVFMDSLVYTGYNIKKHRADGLMWQYVLASQKRGKGWLSDISYGGGCTGYETNSKGLPDISRFERGGLVCASYVTYVYFNYLPNVAGIDTSCLTKPDDPHLANSWYKAAQSWVKKGYSKNIKYTASKNGNYINFKPKSEIPIGSIMCFQDYNNRNGHCSHVAVYAGYKNGYHWMFHVGNDNGPEFCAVERMSCGPDPQWTLAVISTPTNIRFSARAEVEITDDTGAAVAGVPVYLKSKGAKAVSLGKTNSKGKLAYDNLTYGSYTLSYTVPEGYTCDKTSQSVKLTTKNNSCNTFKLKFTKLKPEPDPEEEASSSQTSSTESTQSDASSSENASFATE